MQKIKTNEQCLKEFLKDLDMFDAAIVRERLTKISDITREAIKENPASFDNFVFDHTYYLSVCDKIDKHLGFEDKAKK